MKNVLIISFFFFTHNLIAQSNSCGTATLLYDSSSCISTGYNLAGLTWSGINTSSCYSGTYWGPVDGWFTFTATSDSTTIEATTSGNWNLYLAVFTGGCGSLSEIDCQEPTVNGPIDRTFNTTIGTQYWIQMVNNVGNSAGNICVYETPASNTNCSSATPVCGNSSFSGNSNGDGIEELLFTGFEGCLITGERQSSWYTFTISSGGTLNFIISPSNNTDDYDFAVWGPNETCPISNSPIRCSYSAHISGSANTGLVNGAGDNSEGSSPATTPHWVEELNVNAGESYILIIDNFTTSSSPFNLTWGGTAGLDCSVLPVELFQFDGVNKKDANYLNWSTSSEINNSHFIVQRSEDTYNWNTINITNGHGDSSTKNSYTVIDKDYSNTTNYYKLTQVDFNGKENQLKIISINNNLINKKLIHILNIFGVPVSKDYKGIKFFIFSDGSVEKKVSF